MRRVPWVLLLSVSPFIVSLLVVSGCRGQQQPPKAEEPAQPPYAPVATIKDLMDSIIDPSADVVWESVATVVGKNGTVDRAPKTDEEWNNVRNGAIRLVEGSNLLMMPGRHVARPNEKSSTPGVELEPEEMEKLVNADRAAFYSRAKALHDSSFAALQAIDAKDAEKLIDIGEKIDVACENCHTQYWYPHEKLPPLPPGDIIGRPPQ